MRVASRRKRVIAAIIDMYIGIAIYGIILGISIECIKKISSVDQKTAMLISVILFFVIFPIYYAMLDFSLKGIGKYILRICVKQTSGSRIPFKTGIKRGFLKTISLPILLVPMDYVFRKEQNTFYDRILDTNVYERAKA